VTTLSLDGRAVSVAPGRTVLECAREHGIAIPTLCHLDGLSPASTCRVCLVEVDGLEHPVPACSTAVRDGMVIRTATPRLLASRRAVVELLLVSGHHVCAFCPASGRCELEALARALGVDHLDPRGPRRAPDLDASRPRFALDPGRCVLCTRCVRACAELEGAATLHLAGRGARTRLVTDGGARWADSPSCTDCGRCVAACPTGALLEKASAAQGLACAVRGGARAPARAPASAAALPRPGRRARLATAWLGGCSGCHMSLLDLDERLLALAPRVELVYSPLADAKDVPEDVDVCLVEGAVSTSDELALVRRLRERTRLLVAVGDCAGCGNVTALRDAAGGAGAVLRAVWPGAAPGHPALPALLDEVLPVHAVVPVDRFLPGCPPPADALHAALADAVDRVGAAGPRAGSPG
jgi:ferredoxin